MATIALRVLVYPDPEGHPGFYAHCLDYWYCASGSSAEEVLEHLLRELKEATSHGPITGDLADEGFVSSYNKPGFTETKTSFEEGGNRYELTIRSFDPNRHEDPPHFTGGWGSRTR